MKNYMIFTLIALAACTAKQESMQGSSSATESTTVTLTDEQFKTASIVAKPLEERDISSTLILNGTIDVPPQNLISISIPMGGYLKTTSMLPGMLVKKGQIIATLEDQQYIQLQQDYLLAKTKSILAEQEYARQKELNESDASSRKIFQQATAELNSQKINAKALEQKLQLIGININRLNETNISKSIAIVSPINGYVSKVNANIGKYLMPSEVLFELVNVDDIHLNLTVFEKDLPKLAIGQNLVAYNNNEPEKKYKCNIIIIGHSLLADKSTQVHCHFEKYDKSLVPGMYMNAEVALKTGLAMTTNEEALLRFENKDYVFVQNEKNSFEMVEVKKGVRENGLVEILSAEELTGKKIVTKGAYWLMMKLKNVEEE
jgi:membrane fusion protein, heavy metal efflux system